MNSSPYSLKLARIISNIFIPPANLFYIFIYLALSFESANEKIFTVIGVAFVFGLLFPVLLFLYLMHINKISDEDATIKEERQFPYLISIIFALISMLLLTFASVHIINIIVWFTYFLNTSLLFITNKFWKISAHTLGLSAPLAIIFYFHTALLPVLIILIIIVGWSRVKLNVHTVAQVLAGGIFGFILTIIELMICLKLAA